ncbi:hypothetical protein AQUCO_00500053v1 [Aquilegia coerulea]|uniref:RNA helicase n=1 Tax=Aquilegia coerulea TaxID=218851 RepID=A0A2G5EQ42_AQUCA|nr:hypothetical protein AQUCO_00500053v1 [Aquilegia coerulea]
MEFKSSLEKTASFSSSDDDDEGLEISKLGISQEIVTCLANKGITKLFPIQKATLAFGIPIMDKIIKFNPRHEVGRNPLALVLVPTRELAQQVEKEFHEATTSLETLVVYGGTPISKQIHTLKRGVDVVVGTPDEADQMLSEGFHDEVEIILLKLPEKRQSMMFSSTMPSWMRELTQNYLINPLTVDLVGGSDLKLADGITLYSYQADCRNKASIVGPLITEHTKGGKCIVFTQTKSAANRLAYALKRKYQCGRFHAGISQSQRDRTLAGFRDGRFNILVATDVAARGLGVPDVDLVIHCELQPIDIFVHRSGQTGRAGKKGSAILIHTGDQLSAVKLFEQKVGSKFQELPRIAVSAQGSLGDIGGCRGGYGSSSPSQSSDLGGHGLGGSGGIGGSSSPSCSSN